VVNENRDFITQNIREKIFRVVCALSSTKKGPKHIKVKMEDLADMIGETRLNVSKELNSMNNEGIVKIKRGEFIIENLNNLKCK
jgi:DNA-binding MarR family transcriptional regulator